MKEKDLKQYKMQFRDLTKPLQCAVIGGLFAFGYMAMIVVAFVVGMFIGFMAY